MYICVCAGVSLARKGVTGPLELECLVVVRLPMWVLDIELPSFARGTYA